MKPVILLGALLASNVFAHSKPTMLTSTAIGRDGLVHLRWTGRQESVEPRGEEQVQVSELTVSPGREAVGWAVERSGETFGTSYPMALQLIVIWQGQRRQSIFPAGTIGRWQFEDGGKHVAVFSDTPHGDQSPVCQLYETATGRLLSTWTPRPPGRPPAWALPFKDEW